MRIPQCFAALLLVLLTTSCSKFTGSDSDTPTAPSAPEPTVLTASAVDLAFCVTETNRLRASVGAPALAQHGPSEQFAATAAQADHASGNSHGYLSANPPGVAAAENEALRWARLLSGPTAQTFISRALQAAWAEGPGGGHYENIRNASFTVMGCAVFSDDTTATFVQHFR
jgi:uncharacterized protein YkwD